MLDIAKDFVEQPSNMGEGGAMHYKYHLGVWYIKGIPEQQENIAGLPAVCMALVQ